MNENEQLPDLVKACMDLTGNPILEVSADLVDSPVLIERLTDKGFFVARIDPSPIGTRDELLQALADVCNFPSWFGFNWDALNDSLSDFHWIPELPTGFILLLRYPNSLQPGDLDVFIEIIKSANRTWITYDKPFRLLLAQE